MIAKVLLRAQPHYRKQAFLDGLKQAGYELASSAAPKSKDDILVIWNRYGAYEQQADAWERMGGTVLVVENGYTGGYAISLGQHHRGICCERDFDGELLPWRDGDYVLICGQRGIGSRLMASPPNWHMQMAAKLKKLTDRPIRVRTHPGNKTPTVPLEHDLENAHCCVVWSSGSGVKALSLGVPVFYAAPHWICEDAALRPEGVETPLYDDAKREMAFRRMAGSQFTVAEIERGEPFVRLRESLC